VFVVDGSGCFFSMGGSWGVTKKPYNWGAIWSKNFPGFDREKFVEKKQLQEKIGFFGLDTVKC